MSKKEAPAENVQEVTAAKFPLEKLAKECEKLFGVSDCAFAGATFGLEGEYSIAEMKTIIQEWMEKEVS